MSLIPTTSENSSLRLPMSARWVAWGLGCWLVACCASLVVAQSARQGPEVVSLRYGFGGKYKAGHFTPVQVDLRGGRENLACLVELTVPDGDGYPTVIGTERPLQLLAGQPHRVTMYAKPGRVSSTTQVTLREATTGAVVARRQFDSSPLPDQDHYEEALLSTQRLFVSLGPSIGVESAVAIRRREVDRSADIARLEQASELPTRWYGYDGVDMLVLSTSQPEIYRQLPPDSPQWAALDEWIQLGGRLLVCVGREAPEMLAADGPLARYAPGSFDEVVPLRDFASLEEYSEDLVNPVPLGRGGRGLEVARLTGVQGLVEVRAADDLPLVVRSPYGLGQVVFMALDLDDVRLDAWKAREKFVARLLGLPTRPSPSEDTDTQRYYQTYDLASELRSGLDQFQGVKVAPFWLVAVLVLGYIVLIGPGDYFFVRRVLKRMEYTWITFPIIVIVVSGGAYLLARWMKGDELLVNQIDVVDVDLSSGLVRGTSWTQVFSPVAAGYDVASRAELPTGAVDDSAQTLVTWLGLPGPLLGGMNQAAGDAPLWSRPYRLASQFEAMLGVPIQVWSTKGFTTRWHSRSAAGADWIEADLQGRSNNGLEGTITNRLDVPLKDAFLVYGDWYFRLDELAAGATFELDANRVGRRTLRSELGSSNDEEQFVVPSFYGGPLGDRDEIIRRMMFYSALFDEDNENFVSRYHSFLDLGRYVAPGMGRAALVARIDRAGSALLLNGQPVDGPNDQHWHTYRFLLHVEPDAPAR